jgi:hypothetical protein
MSSSTRRRYLDRKRHLSRRYGVSLEDYNKLVRLQHGRCAICFNYPKRGGRLGVDHNHDTGKVRGLLCHKCNPMLGNANDSILVLQKAIQYLRSKVERTKNTI